MYPSLCTRIVSKVVNPVKLQVDIDLRDDKFHGVMYVKGHSNEERCRLAVDFRETGVEEINFKVLFGTCGLFHNAVSKPLYFTVGRVSIFIGSF